MKTSIELIKETADKVIANTNDYTPQLPTYIMELDKSSLLEIIEQLAGRLSNELQR